MTTPMKFNALFLLLMIVIVSACASKQEASNDQKDEQVEWKEMDEFHTVMADMYHPLKDSNNLEPIKSNAAAFAAAAQTWAKSPLPAKVDSDATRGLLSQLDSGAQDLQKMIADGAPDEEIGSKLTALHDTFHSIMESWYAAGKEEGATEHHDH